MDISIDLFILVQTIAALPKLLLSWRTGDLDILIHSSLGSRIGDKIINLKRKDKRPLNLCKYVNYYFLHTTDLTTLFLIYCSPKL